MWKDRHKLKLHDGPGFPEDYFKKHKPGPKPDPHTEERARIIKRAKLPEHLARRVSRLKIEPKALKALLVEITALRVRIEATEKSLEQLRDDLDSLTRTGSVPHPVVSNAAFIESLFN